MPWLPRGRRQLPTAPAAQTGVPAPPGRPILSLAFRPPGRLVALRLARRPGRLWLPPHQRAVMDTRDRASRNPATSGRDVANGALSLLSHRVDTSVPPWLRKRLIRATAQPRPGLGDQA